MTRENVSRQTTTTYSLSRLLTKTLALLLAALGLALPAPAQTPVVEAKNADETTVLQVNADGGLLGLGAFSAGVIPVEGAGTRLMWHPGKAAFRAGRIGFLTDGSEWDEANVGLYSAAFGLNTMASGTVSTALGSGTTASGIQSTAMGFKTMANGFRSTAMGRGTTASGEESAAMGGGTTASGRASTAMGIGTTASGERSTAMGQFTTAQAYASLAIGQYNVVEGNPSLWTSTDPLFVAGNGSDVNNPSNALTLLKNGDLTIAGDLTESSDRRLKTDITPLGDVLAALEDIKPVRYQFKAGTSRPAGPQLGLIAQEVQVAFPELVSRGADGYLSVAYPKLAAVLLKGVQEQQAQIDALRAENAATQERLATLEARVQDGPPVIAGWSGWGAASLLAVLVLLGGLLIRRQKAEAHHGTGLSAAR